MKKLFNYRAIPVFLLVLIISICVGTFLHYAFGIALILLVISAFITVLTAPKLRKYTTKFILILIASIIGLGSIWISFAVRGTAAETVSGNASIKGYIANISPFDENGKVSGANLYLRNASFNDDDNPSDKRLSGYVMLINVPEDEIADLYVGSSVTLKGRISTIGIDPSDSDSIRNYRERINYAVFCDRITYNSKEVTEFNLFDSIKTGVKSILYKYCGDSAPVMYAMIFGDKSDIDGGVRDVFSATGMAHLLAVSGLHVSMFALLIMWLLRKMKVNEFVRIGILGVVLILFDILCCMAPSVIRATIMIIVCYLANALGLKNDSISTLSFAGVCMLIFRPFYLYDLAFLMSFTAVVSLIFFSKPIKRRLSYMPSVVSDVTGASLAVNFGMLPVTLCSFGTVSLLFGLANLIILPIISFVYPIMISLVCLGFIPYLGYALVPLGYLFGGGISLLDFFSVLPFPKISAGFDWIVIIPFFILMVAMSKYFMADKRFKKALTTLMIAVIFVVTIVGNNVFTRVNVLTNVYYDRFDNESMYILETEAGRQYLIANCELDAFALDSAVYYMKYNGISSIDALIKEQISEREMLSLRNRYQELNIENVVSERIENYYYKYINAEFYTYSPFDDLAIEFYYDDEIAIFTKDLSFLFSYNYRLSVPGSEQYDIIVAPNALADAVQYAPEYIVNNDGYKNFIDYCVPNSFTFKAINGKIKAMTKP